MIAECGGKEVETHLLTAPKNANYMSPLFIAKYISIINHYNEEPLLASLHANKYSLYNDETQDITSVEQMAIYTSFEHNGKISEHYVGILPLSKLVGTDLSANILKALQSYLEKQEVPIDSSRFFMMDTTNVNSRENGGLKRLLHVIPIAAWIGCGSHEVAFCFKHLLNEFPSVADADATLLALWKFFHYRPLEVNFLENASEIYGEPSIVPVCPSVTRWTAHDRACKNLYNGYIQFSSALTVCLNERKEPESLGLFTEIKDEEFTATILMLRDVLDAVQPLNLVLHKGDGSLCLSDLPIYLNKTLLALEKLHDENKRLWFNRKKFLEMQTTAEEQPLSLPPSANLRNSIKFSFKKFRDETYPRFITRFVKEIKEAFTQLDFLVSIQRI